MYYIIRKIHADVNDLEYTPVGYVLSSDDAQYIDDDESKALAEQWMGENIADLKAGILTPADYFKTAEPFYIDGYSAGNIDGMGLSEITDLDNPEGV